MLKIYIANLGKYNEGESVFYFYRCTYFIRVL